MGELVAISKNRTKKFGSARTSNVWDKTKGKCWYCGVELNPPTSDKNSPLDYLEKMFTIDHCIPLSKGGQKNDIDNMVPCCRSCNNLKGNYEADYLRMRLLCLEKKWPKFTPAQYDFLSNRGIELSRLEPYKFHFEKAKLK